MAASSVLESGKLGITIKSRVWLFLTVSVITSSAFKSELGGDADPTPAPWPEQFHSVLVMNYSGKVELIDLWYDLPNGRNFNIIQKQLGKLVFDLEWNNGTSFVYTLDEAKECQTLKVGVGILLPNWLDGATYFGRQELDGFMCNVWEKADFIRYYEDVETRRPVHWVFYTGRHAHVMTFEVGAALDDSKWQAPAHCFDRENNGRYEDSDLSMLRGVGGGYTGSVGFL